DAGPVEGKWWNNGIHTRPIRETGVDHRAHLVDTPSDSRHNAVDDLHEMLVVAEDHARLHELAPLFDEHVTGSVDHDFADRRILQQQFHRPQPEGLIEHLFNESVALVAV